MDKFIFIDQIILSLLFLMVGGMKLLTTKDKLAAKMAWVEDFSSLQIKGIGSIEVLGALGVILPQLTGILPILSSIAAFGLALTMMGAGIVHVRRREYPFILVNIVLLAMAMGAGLGQLL